MPNKTYLGSIYKEKQADGEGWNFHLFATHADAVIEGDNKKFVSQDELSFIQTLIGGGDTGDTAYSELVDKVNTNEGNITGLQDDVNAINVLIGADEDGIINKLEEIINFIEQSAIEEGMSIEDFVETLRADLKINNVEIGSETAKSIYAPTSPGTTDQILVSTGNKPEFKTVKNVITKETAPTPADYGRTNFQGGEIWIDTGSGVLPDPITTYNMVLKFNAPSDILDQFIAFIENPNNQGIDYHHPAVGSYSYSVPIITFNTNEGIRRLEFYIMQSENYGPGQYYGFQYAGGLYPILECNRTSNYEPGMPEDHTWSTLEIEILNEQEIIIPGGQVLSDNRLNYEGFPSGFEIKIVPN